MIKKIIIGTTIVSTFAIYLFFVLVCNKHFPLEWGFIPTILLLIYGMFSAEFIAYHCLDFISQIVCHFSFAIAYFVFWLCIFDRIF